MKKNISKIIGILLIIVIGGGALIYKVYEFKKNKDMSSSTQTSTQVSSSSETGKNTSQNTNDNTNKKVENKSESNKSESNKSIENKSTSSKSENTNPVKEKDKNIDRSKTVDVNKVEEIISKKLPKGVITDLEFENDSKNPHYEVTVVSENVKYEFEVSSKDGATKEIKKEKIKTIS